MPLRPGSHDYCQNTYTCLSFKSRCCHHPQTLRYALSKPYKTWSLRCTHALQARQERPSVLCRLQLSTFDQLSIIEDLQLWNCKTACVLSCWQNHFCLFLHNSGTKQGHVDYWPAPTPRAPVARTISTLRPGAAREWATIDRIGRQRKGLLNGRVCGGGGGGGGGGG